MNKKAIFKIVGGVLAGIIVILIIIGVVYYREIVNCCGLKFESA